MLLEGLARRGHECAAITPAFAPSAGPANDHEFREEMERRGLAVRARGPNVFSYRFRGVDVDALHAPSPAQMREHVERRTRELNPDWVLVNDDKGRVLVAAALSAAGRERVVLVLQTITNTPFGPLAVAPSRRARPSHARGAGDRHDQRLPAAATSPSTAACDPPSCGFPSTATGHSPPQPGATTAT